MPESPQTPPRSPQIVSGFKTHLTLVLGADEKPMGYPLTVLNAKDTASILFLERAEVIEQSNYYILRGDKKPFRLPSVIRMLRCMHNALADKPVAFTPQNLAVRDEATCQYTGKILQAKHENARFRATMDHVIPRYYGGVYDWHNAVLASAWANERKSNLTLEEAARLKPPLLLQRKPWVPTAADMLSISVMQWRTSTMPESWTYFLESIQPTPRVQRIREGKLYALV